MKKCIAITVLMFILCSIFSVTNAVGVGSSKWNLYFDNIKITDGSVTAVKEPQITDAAKSEITYSVNLSVPGDFYEFCVDIVNAGNIDSMVDEIDENILTKEQEKFLAYEVTYLDGTKVEKKDLLKAGTTVTLKIKLEFKKDITKEDLPTQDANISLSINTCYVQADENANDPNEQKPDSNNENNEQNNEPNNEQNSNSNSNANNQGKNGENSANGSASDVNKQGANRNANSVKTGDTILKYAVIGAIAVVAFIFTMFKSKKDSSKDTENK